MAELTKEYFDQKIGGVHDELTLMHKEMGGIQDHMGGLQESVDSLRTEVKELSAHTDHEIQELARMVADGFQEMEKRFDVVERVEKLERDFRDLKQALRA